MSENQLIPTSKSFTLNGLMLKVPENLDLFNSYRLMFRKLASDVTDNIAQEYDRTIYNLDTFLVNFPKLYNSGLDILVKKAVDILISEGIWTVTYESFTSQHVNDFHLAVDDYKIMVESFNLTIEANQQRKANAWSYVPNIIGGGFGIGGMLKGIATATAFNVIRGGLEASSISNANVKPQQRAELYNRLNRPLLRERIFTDYWRVFLSLVWTLNQNGKNIWWPTEQSTNETANIFKNISNPNFPQDKIPEVMIHIIQTNPYNIEYYKYLVSKFGETKEVNDIKNYFGYTSFDNPRIN